MALTQKLIAQLSLVMEGKGGQNVIFVQCSKFVCTIIDYLVDMKPDLISVAAFDTDPAQIGRTFDDVPGLPLSKLDRVVSQEGAGRTVARR